VTEQAENEQAEYEQAENEQAENEQDGTAQWDDQGTIGLDRTDEDQSFVDQSKIDFNPDDGLYSGTAVDGSSEIPGPHQDNETGELSGADERESEEQDESESEEQ
jgi:hypothetical protein